VLISASALHFFHDGIADGLAIFLPLWQAAFGLSLAQVGLLVTCFEGATGFFQLPAGLLGERFGERKLLLWGTVVTAVSIMFLGLVGGVIPLVVLLLAGGLGAAVQHPLASSMVHRAYKYKGRRMALGTYNFSGDVGKFLYPALGAVVLSQFDWRELCAGYGIIGCVIAATLLLVLMHVTADQTTFTGKSAESPLKKRDWGIVNKGAFTNLSLIGIVDTAVRTALVIFGPFLFIQKGMHPESVGFALSLLFIGGAVGKFLCGALAERIGIIAMIVITESITGCGILLLTVLPLSHIYLFLPILGAALNGTSSVFYATVADFVDANRVARAFGLFYTFVIAAAATAPPIMGRISDILGVDDSLRVVGLIALCTLPMAVLLLRQMGAADMRAMGEGRGEK
jgi:MFS family permease